MFGLRNLKRCGKKLSSDSSSANQFVNELSRIAKGYFKYQIFCCDETRLYFRMLQGFTLALVYNHPDREKNNERVTTNTCANAS